MSTATKPQWKKDIEKLLSLSDSTMLMLMDSSLINSTSQSTKIKSNLDKLIKGRAVSESWLTREESKGEMSESDLRVWEDLLVKLASQIEKLESLTGNSAAPLPGVQRHELINTNPEDPYVPRVQQTNTSNKLNSRNTVNADVTDQQLSQLQVRMFEDQDAHLEQLSHVVSQQKQIGIHMNEELESQIGLLEEVDNEVDQTGSRLQTASRRLEIVSKKVKEQAPICLIFILVLILIVLWSVRI